MRRTSTRSSNGLKAFMAGSSVLLRKMEQPCRAVVDDHQGMARSLTTKQGGIRRLRLPNACLRNRSEVAAYLGTSLHRPVDSSEPASHVGPGECSRRPHSRHAFAGSVRALE